ncbi:MAG: hypothetical protein K2Y05_02930 [Hyphomicrobiaceae bacterium]|nr:hypothetical protein [Hyphomicrobiaceae bacterium]
MAPIDRARIDIVRAVSSTGDPAVFDDFEAAADVRFTTDGGLSWSGTAAMPWAAPTKQTEPGGGQPWIASTEALVDGRPIQLMIETHETRISVSEFARLSLVLTTLNDLTPSLVLAVDDNFHNGGSLSDLLVDLYDQVSPAYLAELFPDCAAATDVTAQRFVDGLVACDVTVALPAFDISVGYRLLVDTLTEDDLAAEVALQIGGRFDLTGQVIVAILQEGQVTALRIDS